VFTRYLAHPDLPDVDLLWRTGGESRTSNFLPWQAVYAEYRFTDGHWPDMDRRDLWQAITDYASRERRYGTIPVPNNRDTAPPDTTTDAIPADTEPRDRTAGEPHGGVLSYDEVVSP